MATKIKFSLSPKSIQNAIKQIEKYQSSLNVKCEVFCRRMVELGEITAKTKISEAPLGKYVTVTTDIKPEKMGCKAVLIATGGEKSNSDGSSILPLMCIEFGAGVHYNSITNPNAGKLGMGVGTYPGQTHAFEDGWYYLGDDDEWHYTHGVKATMPMYSADIEMILNIRKIAKEVFSS